MTWTRFSDMHSGGGCKEKPFEEIYIEAPKDEAVIIFYNRFGHNPNRVSCTCCGEDYWISEEEDLAQLSAHDRSCRYDDKNGKYVEEYHNKGWGQFISFEEWFVNSADYHALIINSDEITPEQRVGTVPTQGYVWK